MALPEIAGDLAMERHVLLQELVAMPGSSQVRPARPPHAPRSRQRSRATSASLACSAAMRTMPVSKNTRASLRCSSEVGEVASRCLADSATWSIIVRAVGATIRARSPWVMVDEAHALERLHGLAHGGAADAVLAHQVALGRQMIARGQLAAGDPREQAVNDLVRQLAPPDRFALDHAVVWPVG